MNAKMIDFRSDTVTQPCQQMRAVMANAEVGDDVYGDDPTVNKLEAIAAEMAEHEAALFCSSGTQTNLLALMAHCQRGDEYIVGGQAHTYKYEGGGAAVLGSIQPQPIEFEPDGTLDLSKVKAAIKEDDFHFARTRLLALENTTGGKVIPQVYIQEARQLARENGLVFHLDGARVANAVVAQGLSLADVTREFDSVSICLSKGLGAPIGSVLVGDKSVVDQARRTRKMLGGGMRQAGVIAAAALFALENNIDRLREDHDNAAYLGEQLRALGISDLQIEEVHTNMVFAKISESVLLTLNQYLFENGVVLINNPQVSEMPERRMQTTRLVTHKDVSRENIDVAVSLIGRFFEQTNAASA